ncbi:MAG: PD40 domain-containing protein [Planctomycetes bacterium]|nr:PD40 domain-containing protein [Planctomycetota bacterium]
MRWLSLVLIPAAIGCSPAEDPRPSRIAFAIDRSGTNRDLLTIDPSGGEATPVAAADTYDETPAWAPDGLTLVFSSSREGHYGLYTWDKKLEKVALAQYRDSAPSWSPDGRRIAYMSDRGESWQIYSIGPNGRDEKRLTNSKSNDTWPVWSPDGGSLLFLSERGGQQDLYLMKVLPAEREPNPKPDKAAEPVKYAEEPKAVTNDRAWDGRPSWSPDGKWIAWPSQREGKSAIYVMDAAGNNVRRLTPLDSEADEPSWSPDGKRIVFVSTRDGFRELYLQGANEKTAKRLTFLRGQIHTPAWSPFLPASK